MRLPPTSEQELESPVPVWICTSIRSLQTVRFTGSSTMLQQEMRLYLSIRTARTSTSRGLEETSLVFAYHYTWTSGEQAIITLDENRTLVYFYSIGPFAIGSYLIEQLSEENYDTFLREIQVFYESGGDKNFSSKSAGTCAALKQGGPYRDLGPWPPIFMLNNSTHVVPLQFFTHISYHTQTIEGQPWRDLGTTLRETLRPICAN